MSEIFNKSSWAGKYLPDLNLEQLQDFVKYLLDAKSRFQLNLDSEELKKLRLENELMKELLKGRR